MSYRKKGSIRVVEITVDKQFYGQRVEEFVATFNHQQASLEIVYQVRAWARALKQTTEDDRRAYTMCQALEKWILDDMGFVGEYKL